jgi:hypothetical protein
MPRTNVTDNRVVNMTREDCERWKQNPTRNPVAVNNARIDPNVPNGRFAEIQRICREKYNIRLSEDEVRTARTTQTNRTAARTTQREETLTGVARRLFDDAEPEAAPAPATATAARTKTGSRIPKTALGMPVPKTEAEWNELATRMMAHLNAVAPFKFRLSVDKDLLAYKKLFNIAFENHLIPPAKYITLYHKLLAQLAKPERKILIKKYDPELIKAYRTDLVNMVHNVLMSNDRPNHAHLQILKENLEGLQYFGSFQYPYDTSAKDAFKLLLSVEALLNDVVLDEAQDEQNNNVNLPDSPLLSEPDSMSDSKTGSRKFSKSYKRHAALSAIKVESTGDMPPLPEKTRQTILKELGSACSEMKDAISYESFRRMPKKNLQLVVQLGKNQPKRCYYVRNIYNKWVSDAKDNKPFTDPLTREGVSAEDKDEIMRKVKYISKNATDPRDIKIAKDKKLTLNVDLESVVVGNELHNFFHIKVKRTFGTHVYSLYDLGFVPADIEPEDMGGSLNLSSAVIINNIRILFDQGRLLTNNVIPYQCCRIHLAKPARYWVDPEGPKGISAHRIRLMAEEIEQFL